MALIEVEYGYGNSAKGGRNLPLNVVLRNDEAGQFRGTVEILTRQSDNSVYDLQGRLLESKPAKGVFIMNGKKLLAR